MGLDIGIEKNKKVEYLTHLDDDGYYWYLHPLFDKLRKSTGVYIDLYGYAEFDRDSIEVLESMLSQASEWISKEPDIWKVHTGSQLSPIQKEIYETVTKIEFEKKLKLLNQLISEVKESGSKLIFMGD